MFWSGADLNLTRRSSLLPSASSLTVMYTPGSSWMIHSVTSSSLALLMETSSLDEVVVLAASVAVAVAVASEAAGLLPADAPWFCRCCCCQARSDGVDEEGGGGESGRKLCCCCCRAAPGGRANAPQLILSGVSGAGDGVAAGLPAMEPTWDCE